ncbi:MAG TPA: hypothetical protein V6D47_06560 [Oscillatoriaceae cyanobacterium]
MRALWAIGAAIALLAAGSRTATASTLPGVDFGTQPLVGLAIGTGLAWAPSGAVSFDLPLGESFMVGASAGTSYGTQLNFDVRGIYRLVVGNRESPTIGVMAGLWGAPGMAGFQLPGGVAPFVGFGLSYDVTKRITARLNLAYSPFFNYNNTALLFMDGPPSAGVELGYKVRPNLQATLGLDGRGDLLGLSWTY